MFDSEKSQLIKLLASGFIAALAINPIYNLSG